MIIVEKDASSATTGYNYVIKKLLMRYKLERNTERFSSKSSTPYY